MTTLDLAAQPASAVTTDDQELVIRDMWVQEL